MVQRQVQTSSVAAQTSLHISGFLSVRNMAIVQQPGTRGAPSAGDRICTEKPYEYSDVVVPSATNYVIFYVTQE